ncbi:putative polysaccharide biosynthesis protein [Bacillus sonorensis]|uniref:putative polysaccharide biosynthesis protein n=1 Tax=Bacillus sonorensis TaxID=119858 RepID=UPI00227FB011|nr:polysaccharide biosynthesis protein [Bacillus sonorensis]MCY7859005.1 polysaccharide biosynthesis protein [Bacillus sonorensis]MCY8036228.1 polysaccharide biosynthesis protein [Bacillus sonorensis]MCY8563435.1 polysaccharide biosynthesis protein [Bacillus sonorensis]MEC1503738.1 polysaccharide biosynthesis protein [Bacillus sonorensis]
MGFLNGQSSRLWQGAFVLSLAGILSKILSAVYRVPFQNIVGDVGFYIFQQVYPMIGISVMLVTSGFPVIISKLLNDFGAESQTKIIRVSMLFISGVAISFFLLLFAGAKGIAGLMGDPGLAEVIRAASYSYLLIPFVSIFRGYFQGNELMMPTAFSQIGEQMFRVAAILCFTWWLVNNGYTLYDAGAGAAFGSLVGGLTALFILGLCWIKRERNRSKGRAEAETKTILKQLCLYTVTICVTSLMMILIQLVDALNLYSLLAGQGMDEMEAKHTKGVYDRGQPLLQLGTVFAAGIATALVPSLTKAKKQQEMTAVQEKTQYSLKMSLVIGIGAAMGLSCILEPVNVMLFKNSEGTAALQIFSVSIFFASLAMTITAVLQGFGDTVYPAVAVLAGFFFKIVLNVVLIPVLGIAGAALATVISFAAVAGLNLFRLKRTGLIRFSDCRIGGMFISALIMSAVLIIWLYTFEAVIPHEGRWISAIESLTAVFIGGAVFLYSILKCRVFSDKELELVPFGNKLITLNKKGAAENGR